VKRGKYQKYFSFDQVIRENPASRGAQKYFCEIEETVIKARHESDELA
jgi:hypothetical protein